MALLWIDGRLEESAAACIFALDRGLLYGDGLFTTVRIRGGEPVLIGEHLARLDHDAAALGFQIKYTHQELLAGMQGVIDANAIIGGVVRLTITRGVGLRGLVPAGNPNPTVLITVTAGIPYEESLYATGLRAVLLPWPRNERSPLTGVKSLNRLEDVLGARAAAQAGADEGLFLNTAGFLAEGTRSNVFLVRGGRILTPPEDAGLLPGVTRRQLLLHGIAKEERLTAQDLLEAEEAFLTNSILEVAPLVRVDEHGIGTGRPGPMTKEVMAWYKQTD